MKWFRNKEMLRNTLEENNKLIEKTCSQKFIWSLKDYNNLIKDHLELLEENQKLTKAIEILKDKLPIQFLGYNKYGAKPYEIICNGVVIGLVQQEYELLKEVLE